MHFPKRNSFKLGLESLCQAFLKLVVEHDSEVLDMAQFLLGGGLMFTFVLKASSKDSR